MHKKCTIRDYRERPGGKKIVNMHGLIIDQPLELDKQNGLFGQKQTKKEESIHAPEEKRCRI